jgi:uncharacterized protein
LVMQLPKLPGTKEYRYIQLLTGEPDLTQLEQTSTYSTTSASSALDELRSEVQELRDELAALREKFNALLDQLS